ncbi:hypothetical protein H0H81_006288, partial [Sphagnurus paluster]
TWIALMTEVYAGLESLMQKVAQWRKDPTAYSPTEMRAALDNLAEVLFEHLDEEVEDLRGDNLKPHFKLEEIEKFTW